MHDRFPQPLLQLLKFPADFRARQRIERAERLIHQQDRRIGRQRPRHSHALALPAGKLVRIAPQKLRGIETHQRQQLLRARAHALGRPAFQPRHQRNVLLHRVVRKSPVS